MICVSHRGTSQFELAIFQVPSSHLWPVSTMLDSTDHWGARETLKNNDKCDIYQDQVQAYKIIPQDPDLMVRCGGVS